MARVAKYETFYKLCLHRARQNPVDAHLGLVLGHEALLVLVRPVDITRAVNLVLRLERKVHEARKVDNARREHALQDVKAAVDEEHARGVVVGHLGPRLQAVEHLKVVAPDVHEDVVVQVLHDVGARRLDRRVGQRRICDRHRGEERVVHVALLMSERRERRCACVRAGCA